MATDSLGIFPGVPFEEYARIDAINGSSIVHLRKSPMYYRFMCDNPQPPTPSMVLGTATHRMILEPERAGDLAVWGEGEGENVRRGKVWDSFQSMHADKLIVTVSERDAMVGMAIAARKYAPIYKYASAKGQTEVAMVWRDPASGRLFKGRADKLCKPGHSIFDLKTTRNCQKYKFSSQAYQLGYHIKMAMYWSGYQALTGNDPKLILGAIESRAPYESAVYRVTSDVILQGLEDLAGLLKKLDECEQTGHWPAAEPEELELSLPSYAYPQESDDLSDLQLVEN